MKINPLPLCRIFYSANNNSCSIDESKGKKIDSIVISVLLGGRVHDAAVTLGISDRAMRDTVLNQCKARNPAAYEEILLDAAHQNFTTIPVKMLGARVHDFFDVDTVFCDSISDHKISHQEAALSKILEQLSIRRLMLDALKGRQQLLQSQSA